MGGPSFVAVRRHKAPDSAMETTLMYVIQRLSKLVRGVNEAGFFVGGPRVHFTLPGNRTEQPCIVINLQVGEVASPKLPLVMPMAEGSKQSC